MSVISSAEFMTRESPCPWQDNSWSMLDDISLVQDAAVSMLAITSFIIHYLAS